MVLIRDDVRDALGVAAGVSVHARLELDSAPREVSLPDNVAAAGGGEGA